MTQLETVSVDAAGAVPIPPAMRQLTGIQAGSVVTLEVQEGVIVLRPVPDETEVYTRERKAEFLLSNAVDVDDYAAACEEVRRLGLNPVDIPHHRPAGV
jgi:bifunctional DNA-binding transcriptional regulator/antitoxin component of YhaV-PrlF toxin-antitoxin module